MKWGWTFLYELKENIRPADFFDIAVISVFLYSAITWFKQTASRSVIIGVSVVTFIYFLARTFNLYLTSLLFQGVFAVLLVALVVVFQEDLRRVFERIATLGTFRERRRQAAASPMIDGLIEVLSTLASEKIGALVVLKGREPLERHIQGGVPLYGRMSQPLLYSLFDPHSPGHDGAVLVEGDRVTKFSCHLPLSKNLREIGNQGTRHTAALGLSECSDALVLVVSEERGVISLAQRGRLERIDSAAKLKNRLESFYHERFQGPASGGWREFFRQDARVKIFSVLLACLVWFLFAYQVETIQRTFGVPIEYRNLPADWLIEGNKPSEARVTLSGSERAFNLLNPSSLILSLDMGSLREGTQRFVLTEENLRTPTNLSFSRVEPSVIVLEAHQVVAKTLPVEVQIEGKLPRRMELVSIQPNPPHVEVRVWKFRAEETDRILTEPVDLGSIKHSEKVRARLMVPEHVRLVNLKPAEVRVSITVAEETN